MVSGKKVYFPKQLFMSPNRWKKREMDFEVGYFCVCVFFVCFFFKCILYIELGIYRSVVTQDTVMGPSICNHFEDLMSVRLLHEILSQKCVFVMIDCHCLFMLVIF